MTPPANDEVEVTVIGPSYGESILVHLGDGRWVIVDSTWKDGDDEPAQLKYLRSIGLDPAECVKLVVATHWHDDHIKGILRTVETCKNADVCVPSSFTKDEFLSFLAAHTDTVPSRFGSGVDEITGVFKEMRTRTGGNRLAMADMRLMNISGGELSHGRPTEVWSLSPSGFQVTESLGKMAALIPGLGKTKRRAVPTDENDHSIALWISIGEVCVLLGADLEETKDSRAGWSAVVSSKTRPQGQAEIFKVPHHGSSNGHNPSVWTTMLTTDPHAIVTPWNRSRKLPTQNDLRRLGGLTKNLHLTAPPADLARVRHDYEVEKLLRDFGIQTFREAPEVGLVTVRKRLGATDWTITRSAA